MAKLFGGYHNLKAGHCSEGLQLLTGAPIECLKMSDYAEDLELFWGRSLVPRSVVFCVWDLSLFICGNSQITTR